MFPFLCIFSSRRPRIFTWRTVFWTSNSFIFIYLFIYFYLSLVSDVSSRWVRWLPRVAFSRPLGFQTFTSRYLTLTDRTILSFCAAPKDVSRSVSCTEGGILPIEKRQRRRRRRKKWRNSNGHYTAMHATLTASNFFLTHFYPSGPFTCIFFSKSTPDFSCVGCG